MSSSLIPRRVISVVISNSGRKCYNRRSLCSGVLSTPPKEPISTSQTVLSDSPPTPPPTSPEVEPSAASSPLWRRAWDGFNNSSYWKSTGWTLFKAGIITTVAGATVTAGYATYAYTLDEIDEKTKRLREPANQILGNDASAIDKFQSFVSSTAKTVPAKGIEFYLDMRRALEEQVRGYTEPTSDKLLPELHPAEQHVFTLVLDLNETLLYSDWKRERGWRTFKRPGVEAFLEHMAKFYEIVVYSDQLNMYVDPVLERLDKSHCVRYRLSRDATKYMDGTHYRDLSKLNRDPRKIIYVSGHALESCLQRENCVPIKAYKLEEDDTALLDLIPFLEYVARSSPPDIRAVLESYQGKDISKEFIERSKDYQRRMQEQRQQGRLWRR